MKQYQCVLYRLRDRTREDEESLTDLLNERARMGWSYHSLAPLDTGRILVVFTRDA